MKILVVGAGSIGARHINNLISMGHEVCVVDRQKEALKKIAPKVKGVFLFLSEALKEKFDIAFICTFSNNHIGPALECAKAGSHLFIEKPLSTDLAGVQKLIKVIKEKKLVSMVGCNMRFHPAIVYLRWLLEKNPAFRKTLLAELEFGYYLPFAKPHYQKSYQVRKGLGGNIIFDCIHELDYAVWFFGSPIKVFCSSGKVSGLRMNTQDYAEIITMFKSGLVCSIHLDYLQHSYSRRCKIICEDATLLWDFTNGKVGVVTKDKKKWQWKSIKTDLYYNKMYADEIKYFINSVKAGRDTFNSIENAVETLKLALAAEKSRTSQRWEYVNAR